MTESSGIVELYAQHLEAKASSLVVRLTVVFGIVGAVLGGFPLFGISNSVVPSHLGLATLLLGAFAGSYIGYTLGQRRAVEIRFQAQLALHQLQVEQSLIARTSVPAPAPAVPQPAPVVPQPAPVVQQPVAPPAPAPVAPAPVAPAPVAPAPVPVSAPPLGQPPLGQPPLVAPPVAPAPVSPAPVPQVPVSPPAEPPAATVVAPPPLLAPAPPLSSTGS